MGRTSPQTAAGRGEERRQRSTTQQPRRQGRRGGEGAEKAGSSENRGRGGHLPVLRVEKEPGENSEWPRGPHPCLYAAPIVV